MGQEHNKGTGPAKPRAGVASLELCLALPLLLLVMALFINAGTSAAWKVRAQGAARDAVWRARWPRAGSKPQPGGWPNDAQWSIKPLGASAILDDPAIDLPVTQGPTIGQIDVVEDRLDMTIGARRGLASIERERPLLSKLGSMKYSVDHPVFDRVWSYEQTGLSSNNSRRIKALYNMHEGGLTEWSAYQEAVAATEAAVQTTNLLPLTFYLGPWDIQDRTKYEDPDFLRLWYSTYEPLVQDFRPRSRDFHPRISGFQTLDAAAVYKSKVAPLIVKIKGDQKKAKGVPETMAKRYIGLYTRAIKVVEKDLQYLKGLNPQPAGLIAAVQAELDARKSELEPKIEELEAFRGSL